MAEVRAINGWRPSFVLFATDIILEATAHIDSADARTQHSGYGLGFERLVCYITAMENIRDAIAYPRYPGSAEF